MFGPGFQTSAYRDRNRILCNMQSRRWAKEKKNKNKSENREQFVFAERQDCQACYKGPTWSIDVISPNRTTRSFHCWWGALRAIPLRTMNQRPWFIAANAQQAAAHALRAFQTINSENAPAWCKTHSVAHFRDLTSSLRSSLAVAFLFLLFSKFLFFFLVFLLFVFYCSAAPFVRCSVASLVFLFVYLFFPFRVTRVTCDKLNGRVQVAADADVQSAPLKSEELKKGTRFFFFFGADISMRKLSKNAQSAYFE